MILLGEVLGCEMSWLLTHSDDEISSDERFEQFLKRRISHEPLEYILGRELAFTIENFMLILVCLFLVLRQRYLSIKL